MAKPKAQNMQVHIIKEQQLPVEKADTSVQITQQEGYNTGEWIIPPNDFRGLRNLVKNSTILPQCVRAYKNNIAGFGIGVKYIEDTKETPEMIAEFKRAEEIIELLNVEQDTKEVFEDIIEAREIYGISYLEVIRNISGEVVQIEFIKETPSVQKTQPLEPYISSMYYHHGQQIERKKRYCKYKQEIGGKTVYFKEFGDPRIMDRRDGAYLEDSKTLDLEYHANEIMDFTIGTEPYGEIRWIGQVLGVDGSRKAESLNNNYFENGRHTPLMIMVKGGTLTDDSFEKLQQYMNDINRRKVQSAFQLPDLYVGYTTDFNRATAQTAMEVTEKQVFQPERKSLAWAINNRLLNGYQFKYVEAYFLEPDISNPDDLYKLLTVCNNAGGLTPNKAREIIFEAYGEVAEDYPEEWGNIPLAYNKMQRNSTTSDIGQLTMSLQKQIEKAAGNHDDAVVAVMKAVSYTHLTLPTIQQV